MTRARTLSKLGNSTVLAVDSSNNVGIGSTIPDAKLDVVGVVSATQYYGDGSELTGITAEGLTGTPHIAISNLTGVAVTFTGASDFNGALDVDGHTELDDVNVSGASTFAGAADFNGAIDVDGHTELDDVNVSGAITATTFTGNLTGNASGSSGSCSGNAATATLATNASGLSGSPNITINNLVGVAATFSGVVTYEDVTNIDSVGIVTARGGIEFGAAGVGGTITAVGNAEFVGITTARGGFEIGAAGVGGTITSVGNAEFAGITTASKFSGPGNIPGNVTTGTYTIVAADAGKLVSATGTVTLPAATFEVGDAISVYNNTGSDMTLTCSAPTAVYLGTDGSTVTSLTLALRCICTFVCVDTASNDTFVATGGGLS